jgi:hypothetical protein
MAPPTTTRLEYGPSGGAHVRILAKDLHGLEGTVICRRRDYRLLIRLAGIRDVCLEIESQAVEILGATK